MFSGCDHWPSLKLAIVFTGIAIALTATLTVSAQQRTSDSDLSETLAWMYNTYNHGHGQTGWYNHKSGGGPYEEVLVSGSTDTFTYDGCQMTQHVEGNRAAKVLGNVSFSRRFNLRDINPQSIRMTPRAHLGNDPCDPEDSAKTACDHAEIVFKTRLEAPLIDAGSSKDNQAVFGVDDVEYGKRFVRAFRHAVELCGGKPDPF